MALKKGYYKIYQLVDCFTHEYGYKNYVLNHLKNQIFDEAWLFNKNNKDYQTIRITMSNAEESCHDENIDTYINFFKQQFNVEEIKFLDIHISKDEYDENIEMYDYINLDINYAAGINLKNIFPKIYKCLHHVDDEDKEVDNIFNKMRKEYKKRNPQVKQFSKVYTCTIAIIAICIINFILSLYLKFKFNDDTAALIILGADYKTFTLGLKQYYRLITYAFAHGNFLHLLCNMVSLYYLGRYVEYKYGHAKFLLILFFSIFIGGLTQGILSDNSVCVGMSGGLYGLMVVFIADIVSSHIVDLKIFLPTIFVNLMLNFLSTTAWMAHLGGAIGGFVIFYVLKNKNKTVWTVMAVVLLLSLSIKYVTINSINSLYGGTDLKVLQMYNDLGFKEYSNSLLIKLLQVYEKFGG